MTGHPRGFSPATAGGIAFLDLSVTSGWAYGSSQDDAPRYGSWSFHPYDQSGQQMADCYEAVADMIEYFRPRLVAVEAPLPTNIRERNGNLRHVVSNDSTISALRGLIEVSRLACFHLGVRTAEYPAQTVRQVLKGFPMRLVTAGKDKGKRDWKPTIMAWATAVGFSPQDHHAADALVGLEYVAQQLDAGGFIRDLARRRR